MATTDERLTALHHEFERLGLRPFSMPGRGLAVDADGLVVLLERVRRLAPPATWRDVFPDIPAHWIEARPESWTAPYRPLGPYDHQSLPTGPAVHVAWPRTTDASCLDRLLDAARVAAWPIHGGGFIVVTNPDSPTLDAMIVLKAGCDGAGLDDFLAWLDQRSDVVVAAVPRLGNELYT